MNDYHRCGKIIQRCQKITQILFYHILLFFCAQVTFEYMPFFLERLCGTSFRFNLKTTTACSNYRVAVPCHTPEQASEPELTMDPGYSSLCAREAEHCCHTI
jgi:hypothetical protein